MAGIKRKASPSSDETSASKRTIFGHLSTNQKSFNNDSLVKFIDSVGNEYLISRKTLESTPNQILTHYYSGLPRAAEEVKSIPLRNVSGKTFSTFAHWLYKEKSPKMPPYPDAYGPDFYHFMGYYDLARAYRIKDFEAHVVEQVYEFFRRIQTIPTVTFWKFVFDYTAAKSKPRQLVIDHCAALIDKRWIISNGCELVKKAALAVPVMAALSDQEKDRKDFFNKEVYLKNLNPSE